MTREPFLVRLRHTVRRNFLAGLLAVLPLAITIWIIGGMIEVLEWGVALLPPFLRPEALLPYRIPGLGALVTLAMIVLLGIVVSNFVSHRMTQWANHVLLRIPVFRGVYAAVKRLVEAILMPRHESFRRVVLLEYPRKGIWAIGLMTGVAEGEVQEKTQSTLVNVFVPTTPNPTSGYYVLVREDEITPLDMSVEEAFKLVMSGGIVTPQEARLPAPRAARRRRDAAAAS